MISVVIPVHNRERLIARAIESAVAQTLPADEIVVIDDASTDRTADVVAELAASLSNLTLVALKENVGAARARNVGIERASGDLIAFLDSDDVWIADKLSKQIREFDAGQEVVAVFCGVVTVGAVLGSGRQYVPKPTICKEDLYHSNVLMTMSSAVIRKKALVDIGGFDKSLPPCEDWDLFIRLAEVGKLLVVQEGLVKQLSHEGPKISRDRERVLASFDAIFEKIYARISDPRVMRRVRASYEMRMADICSTEYCFEPLRAMTHCCRGLLLAPSRDGLHDLKTVVTSLLKNAFASRI